MFTQFLLCMYGLFVCVFVCLSSLYRLHCCEYLKLVYFTFFVVFSVLILMTSSDAVKSVFHDSLYLSVLLVKHIDLKLWYI